MDLQNVSLYELLHAPSLRTRSVLCSRCALSLSLSLYVLSLCSLCALSAFSVLSLCALSVCSLSLSISLCALSIYLFPFPLLACRIMARPLDQSRSEEKSSERAFMRGNQCEMRGRDAIWLPSTSLQTHIQQIMAKC